MFKSDLFSELFPWKQKHFFVTSCHDTSRAWKTFIKTHLPDDEYEKRCITVKPQHAYISISLSNFIKLLSCLAFFGDFYEESSNGEKLLQHDYHLWVGRMAHPEAFVISSTGINFQLYSPIHVGSSKAVRKFAFRRENPFGNFVTAFWFSSRTRLSTKCRIESFLDVFSHKHKSTFIAFIKSACWLRKFQLSRESHREYFSIVPHLQWKGAEGDDDVLSFLFNFHLARTLARKHFSSWIEAPRTTLAIKIKVTPRENEP